MPPARCSGISIGRIVVLITLDLRNNCNSHSRPITAGGFVDDAPIVFSDITKLAGLEKFLHRSGSPDKKTIYVALSGKPIAGTGVKASLLSCGPAFTATRMVNDYAARMYPSGTP